MYLGMGTVLRDGFTTGTAVAAAAKAAALLLLRRESVRTVEVPLPPVTVDGGCFVPSGRRLTVAVEGSGFSCLQEFFQENPKTENGSADISTPVAWATVIKDGGDDPDATHGMTLRVLVATEPVFASQSTPIVVEGTLFPLVLYAGAGIGTVTLPGLPVAIGEPAINPEPRKQIALAVAEAQPPEGCVPLFLYIIAEEGEKRAVKTLNSRLGIVGGVSILGTQGTSRPYSHSAFKASIEQGFDVAEAMQLPAVFLSTGRRSERLLFSLYPDVVVQAGIQVADYAGFALARAGITQIPLVVWGCFPGKLLKIAQGLAWTHASQGEPDISLLASLWVQHGGSEAVSRAAGAMPTAIGALSLMAEADPLIHTSVLSSLAYKAFAILQQWICSGTVSAATDSSGVHPRDFSEIPGDAFAGSSLKEAATAYFPEQKKPELRLHVFAMDGTLALTLPEHGYPQDSWKWR